ncbi:tRNA (adenosine(37)-N6)-dimethylallyltransferase MiaA [Leptotrichia sp. OH3620_COT-345]|uniref:tRNA (adenosine(37)-N6)-dimethylallyltransferase MiaA n=1 Tax=Leptotrichia sp. OH3620_COT-345 TaxID=2491048 RepID=UPI000F649404|nr:tRNA (adenosine(37)-N6)-dimethylallyltransferase MiaA [Leptotrichia sp. OH3620_COT-345]RRD40247.1 tRNA (adenosine(37)-N6)-dimethylallyltransferase MiaA [Leptotrichia sp. OH3620_COT-345]
MEKVLKGLVISGPTGVGKTHMSISLAKKIKADIISADSMQVYKKMDIGTAKITCEEMKGIKHYMLDVIEPDEDYSVGDFEKKVNKILKEKEEKSENIIIVGGTGLYIKAITDGFSFLPSKDRRIRKELEKKSMKELTDELKKLDEKTFNEIDLNNKVRLIRALEVCLLTGKKFSDLKTDNKKNNNYNFLKIFLTRNREEIYDRINKRVDEMKNKGLEHEARRIYTEYGHSKYKITAIGYKEFFNYFDGNISFEEAIEEIKKESRRYAKRQLTWFRKEKEYVMYNLSEKSEQEIEKEILEKWKNFK